MKKLIFVFVVLTMAFFVSCAPLAPKPLNGSKLKKIRESFEFADTNPVESSVEGDVSLSLSGVTLPGITDLVVYYGTDADNKNLVGSTAVKGFTSGVVAELEDSEFTGNEKLFLYLKNSAFTTGVNEVFSGAEITVIDLVGEVEEVEAEEAEFTNEEEELELSSQRINDVFFDFNEYSLTSNSKLILEDFSDSIEDISVIGISIAGHADERGSNEYNLALGERRAAAVKDYLLLLGFYEENIETLTFGEEVPLCESSNENCWQDNRRAETSYYNISE